nr:phosphatidylserine decarboxylase family protein [candidate division Zixibacteria bacterium]
MIASYGIKFIVAGFFLTLTAILWANWKDSVSLFIISVCLALLTVFLTFFYRNPPRDIPEDSNLILATADGRILSVEDIENEYIGGAGKKVSIFMSPINVHINRIPVSGRVEYVKYVPGKFFRAFLDKASEENEHNEIGLVFNGGRLIFKQIAGIMARRISCTAVADQEVIAGDIYGMIHFGSRAEIFLPEDVEVLVSADDNVLAGETIIGRYTKN